MSHSEKGYRAQSTTNSIKRTLSNVQSSFKLGQNAKQALQTLKPNVRYSLYRVQIDNKPQFSKNHSMVYLQLSCQTQHLRSLLRQDQKLDKKNFIRSKIKSEFIAEKLKTSQHNDKPLEQNQLKYSKMDQQHLLYRSKDTIFCLDKNHPTLRLCKPLTLTQQEPINFTEWVKNIYGNDWFENEQYLTFNIYDQFSNNRAQKIGARKVAKFN